MDTSRGFRRLCVFLTLLYWGVVAWVIANPPWDYDGYPVFAPDAFLAQAAVIYAVLFGIGWTFYGFYGRSFSRRLDD